MTVVGPRNPLGMMRRCDASSSFDGLDEVEDDDILKRVPVLSRLSLQPTI